MPDSPHAGVPVVQPSVCVPHEVPVQENVAVYSGVSAPSQS